MLDDEYIAEMQPFIFSQDTSGLQEFFLVFANFIMSNAAFYNKSGSSMGFVIKIYCVI